MNTKPKTKVLTISLLCCGRPDTTERCLQSLMPIREAVDSEIIVVDTGCDAETRAIVDKYADEVIEFEWCNDFAKARNVQLDAANGEWFMYLDDDEFFIDCEDIVGFFNSCDNSNYGHGGYIIRNYSSFDGKNWIDDRVSRMTKVTKAVHFKGKIHERLCDFSGEGIMFKSYAGHFGYCFDSDEKRARHIDRNRSLLLEMIEEEPNNLRWPTHLAQEYFPFSTGGDQELYKLCEKYLCSDYDWEREQSAYNTFIIGKLYALNEMERYDGVIDEYNHIMVDSLIYDTTKAAAAVIVSNHFYFKKSFEESIVTCQFYMDKYLEMRDDNERLYRERAILVKKPFARTTVDMMCSKLLVSAMVLGKYNYIDRYIDCIKWDGEQLKLGRAFVQLLVQLLVQTENDLNLKKAANYFLRTNTLRLVLKNEIHLNSLNFSVAGLECMRDYFDDIDIKTFINVQIMRKSDAKKYDEIYEIEGMMTEKIEYLYGMGLTEEADLAKKQLEIEIMDIYGIKSLR